ncbi:methylated-DNA--[protein]-cysteine S-methyltransferase [Maridesulfovibrio sp.]|uniref:methylated-DNA--[protein]-cysteine S-methyltransferase n=1 Tax=Maridesulfovibrio sp. TaxID=2795000 RepID=UPI002A18BC1B|nr:methylated-DNA--[protein]-cysteine S-methyltransferase [Maridesulfovibrio sp.]
MKNIYYSRFTTSLCEVVVSGNGESLTSLHLNTGSGAGPIEIPDHWIRDDSMFKEAVRQINEYLAGERRNFDLEIAPEGTDFQKMVWAELCRIPWGETRTYREVAENIGKAKAFRAVGAANSKNPLPLIIPCHRVVGSNGSLTGFAMGLDLKRKLLELEGIVCPS